MKAGNRTFEFGYVKVRRRWKVRLRPSAHLGKEENPISRNFHFKAFALRPTACPQLKETSENVPFEGKCYVGELRGTKKNSLEINFRTLSSPQNGKNQEKYI